MMVANATGCTSIYGGSAPSTPYCKNYQSGRGVAWANSLFEDNAEYGLGMAEGNNRLRDRAKRLLEENLSNFSAETQAAVNEWLAAFEDGEKTLAVSDNMSAALAKETAPAAKELLILKNYFGSIPAELEDAAKIDGCNRFTAFLRIFLPIAFPGVIVCGIFSFLYAWGDLAYGLTFITEQTMRPITAGIFNFMGQYGTKWSYLTAFAVVTIIPVALIFLFMQKYIISGLTSGAVKG